MPNTAPISWKCLLGCHLVLFKERRERETRRLVNAGGQSVAVSLENRSIHPAGTSSGELEQTALSVSAAHNKDEPPPPLWSAEQTITSLCSCYGDGCRAPVDIRLPPVTSVGTSPPPPTRPRWGGSAESFACESNDSRRTHAVRG